MWRGPHGRSGTRYRGSRSAEPRVREPIWNPRDILLSIVRSKIPLFLAKPLRVGDGAVKLVTSFVKLELASLRGLCCFSKKSCDLGGIHRLKIARGIEGLLKDWRRIAARNDDAGRKIHRVVQTLDRGGGLAPKNEMVAHGFHTENSDAVFGQNR